MSLNLCNFYLDKLLFTILLKADMQLSFKMTSETKVQTKGITLLLLFSLHQTSERKHEGQQREETIALFTDSHFPAQHLFIH